MSDKDFKVKNKLQVKGITSAGPVVSDASGNLDSTAYVATQYGGTGTSTSPSSGQILYSSSGTTYAPTTLSSLIQGSSYQADAPSSPDIGDIWIESDSTSGTFDPNIIRRHTFTATEGQTAFVASVAFADGYEQVYFNGLLLLKTTDYTTSSNTTVTLGSAAAAGDIIEIVTITNLNSQNTYTQAEINTIVDTQINNLIASAPAALNTLDELAAALGDDASFATTVTNSLADKVSTSGGSTITASGAAVKPLVLKAAESQTGNLTQWQDSSGNVLTRVYADGTLVWGSGGSALQNSSGRLIVNPSLAASIAVTVKGAVSQTANLQEWQNSAGTILARVSAAGAIVTSAVGVFGAQSNTPNAQLYVLSNSTTNPTFVAKAIASQTANLQEWQISDGTVRARINSDGHIIGSTRSAFGTSAIISGVVVAAVADASTAIPLVVKGAASQTADLQQLQNSAGTVITRVRPDGQIGVGSTLITSTNFFVNNTFSTTHVVATIRGAASQTANLQEWQDSAGVVKAYVDSAGVIASTNGAYIGVGAYIAGTRSSVFSSTAGTIGMVIRGAASQTANLQEWQDSTGAIVAAMWSSGTFSTAGRVSIGNGSSGAKLDVLIASSTQLGLVVKGVISQTANLQEWQNSAGSVLARVDSTGGVRPNFLATNSIYDASDTAPYLIFGSNTLTLNTRNAAYVGLTVKGAASQTADLQEWQDSAGTILAKIMSNGSFFVNSTGTSNDPIAIQRASATRFKVDPYGNVFASALTAGNVVTSIAGTTVGIYTNTASSIGLIVRGATSQTANLQEWQDSAGTVLSNINSTGAMFTTTAAANTNTTQVATTAYVQTELADLVNSAPATLDTLNELAAALGDDASFATTVTNSLANKKTEISSAISANTTLVAGRRYYVTSASAITLTLPASPAQNDQVDIFDASGNAATYNITLGRNSNLINGNAGNFIIDANGYWATLVYTGATYGWKVG